MVPMTSTRTRFVSVHLRAHTHVDIQSAAVAMTTPVGRRVTLSDLVSAAIAVAMRHRDELLAELGRMNGATR